MRLAIAGVRRASREIKPGGNQADADPEQLAWGRHFFCSMLPGGLALSDS
jgi:hypothetical protein